MNRYQEIELNGKKLLSVEMESLIRKGEDTLGVDHANLDSMDSDQMAAYLKKLRYNYQQQNSTKTQKQEPIESQEITDQHINGVDDKSSIDTNEIDISIKAAPSTSESFHEVTNYQNAWTLACCYLWLTSKDMNERKGVMFDIPRPFQELVNKNLWHEVPDQAEWITWNRIHGCALDNFLVSKENIKQYKQSLKEVMCATPHWWREKYLASCE
jgi:hypothetical protein